MCGAGDIGAPAAAVYGVEGLVPRAVGGDVGVVHVAAAAAAIGCRRGQVISMVQVHIGAVGDVAATLVVQVSPVSLAAAEEVASDGGVTLSAGGHLVVHRYIGGSAVAHAAAAVHIAYRAAKDVDIGAVDIGLRGDGNQLAGSVADSGIVGIHLEHVVAHLVIVISTVRAAVEVRYLAAADVHARVAPYVAAHVVAAIHIGQARFRRAADVDIGHVLYIGHVAAAVQAAVDAHIAAADKNIGRDVLHRLAATRLFLFVAVHVAGIAAAVHIVPHRALHKVDLWHAGLHRVAVVAAEDGAHGANSRICAVQQHQHILAHTHTIAAAEDGVNRASRRVDVDKGALLEGSVVVGVLVHTDGLHVAVFRPVGLAVVVGAVAAAVHTADGRTIFNLQESRIGTTPVALVVLCVEMRTVRGHKVCLADGVDGMAGGVCVVRITVVGLEVLDAAHTVVASI